MKDGLKSLGQIKVTVPLILIAALAYVGFRAEGLTVKYLDRFFFTDAQAQELEHRIAQTVDQKISPITTGFKAIILGNIMALEEEVSRLEFIRDFRPTEWTDERRQELLSKQTSLRTQRDAMAAIIEAENR